MKEKLKGKSGITLIALVITIVVLLILAGVSIAMLTGDNGILVQANEAKKANIVGTEKEQIGLAMQSLKMKKHADNVSTIVIPAELQEQLLYDGAKNVTVEPGENNKLVVNYEDSKNSYIVDQDGYIEENGNNQEDNESIYSEDIDESQIAPAELFDFEIIKETASNTKVATTGNISGLPQKEARIKRIKPEYANESGYNPDTGENDLKNTNYEIKYEGITDTLIIPYQVEIEGEMYKITEVNLTIEGSEWEYQKVSLPSIENIIYPNTVKKIIYEGTHGLNYTSNNLNRVKKVVLSESLIEIPDAFFYNGENIEQIEIPSSVVHIGRYAFALCSALTKINIPTSVTSILDSAFEGCTSLTKINIPTSVTSIGDQAFDDCTSLTEINIPTRVTSIGRSAFYGCSALTKINIPSSVTSIGFYAFYGCNSLTTINIAKPKNSIEGAPWEAPDTTKINWNYQGK